VRGAKHIFRYCLGWTFMFLVSGLKDGNQCVSARSCIGHLGIGSRGLPKQMMRRFLSFGTLLMHPSSIYNLLLWKYLKLSFQIMQLEQILCFWTLSIVMSLSKNRPVYWNLLKYTGRFLDKDKTMDNVQKHNICTNVPSSQNFRSCVQYISLSNSRTRWSTWT
jgi:hypothetical protein